jgi:hypothetical protein
MQPWSGPLYEDPRFCGEAGRMVITEITVRVKGLEPTVYGSAPAADPQAIGSRLYRAASFRRDVLEVLRAVGPLHPFASVLLDRELPQ